MISRVQHKKSFITSGPVLPLSLSLWVCDKLFILGMSLVVDLTVRNVYLLPQLSKVIHVMAESP